MTCFSPINAWQSVQGVRRPGEKSEILFREPRGDQGWAFKPIQLPCSRCVGCRLERSRQWAVRCMHEASLYRRNCFITLTYRPECLPDDMSLDVREFQLFMKRLRKRFGADIRFYHCGEYGSKFGRPHYHACIFNFDFDDKVPWQKCASGYMIYRSKALEELWPKGFSSVGQMNFSTAAYTARYIMKKVLGKGADEHYFDPSTGVFKRPEYTTMSRRPGIGYRWFQKFSSDVYPHDRVIVKGKAAKPPRYYDQLLEGFNPELWFDVKVERESRVVFDVDAPEGPSLNDKRLNVEARLNRFERSVE